MPHGDRPRKRDTPLGDGALTSRVNETSAESQRVAVCFRTALETRPAQPGTATAKETYVLQQLRLPSRATIAAVIAAVAAFMAASAIASEPAAAVPPGGQANVPTPTTGPNPTPVWVHCGLENWYCAHPGGVRQFRYGQYDIAGETWTFGRWTVRPISFGPSNDPGVLTFNPPVANMAMSCSNSMFGGDPRPGTHKICEIDQSPWTFCATEGQTCRVDAGPQWVRYGAAGHGNGREGRYTVARLSGNIPCTNSRFGGDPVRDVPKHCWIYNG